MFESIRIIVYKIWCEYIVRYWTLVDLGPSTEGDANPKKSQEIKEIMKNASSQTEPFQKSLHNFGLGNNSNFRIRLAPEKLVPTFF